MRCQIPTVETTRYQNFINALNEFQKPGNQDDLFAIVTNPAALEEEEFSKIFVSVQEIEHHLYQQLELFPRRRDAPES